MDLRHRLLPARRIRGQLPGQPTNPILDAPGPFGRGVGSLYAQYQVFQPPTVSLPATDPISLGFAGQRRPGVFQLNPVPVRSARPSSHLQGPAPVYPTATDGRFAGGAGSTRGSTTPRVPLAFGAAIKSPQWFETYTYNAVPSARRPPDHPQDRSRLPDDRLRGGVLHRLRSPLARLGLPIRRLPRNQRLPPLGLRSERGGLAASAGRTSSPWRPGRDTT